MKEVKKDGAEITEKNRTRERVGKEGMRDREGGSTLSSRQILMAMPFLPDLIVCF